MHGSSKGGISRRAFHRRALAAGTAAAGAGGWLGGWAGVSAQPAGNYVDIHTHLGQEWGVKAALDARGLLDWMDAHAIAQAVVLPLINPESWDHPLTTDYVLKETAAHRDRLIPFCSIDPRTINLSTRGKLDLLRKYQDAGCRGFGEHKCGIAIDDPRNLEIFHACAEVGFPVLLHLDNSRNMDQPGLPGLERVLQAVPEGVFIGHAQGWWASISGDATQDELHAYPKKPVAPGGAMARLFDTYPNIFGDVSAGSGANAFSRDPAHGREFCIQYQDRLLFGTDYLAPDQEVPQFELFTSFALPADVEAKIYRENARKLLGLA